MAKAKLDLHAYQKDILDKLQEATGEAAVSSNSKLGIRVGELNCLVSLDDVNEMLSVPTITRVPLTQPWFLGVANVRGVLYGISDFSALQNKVPTQITRESRVLITHQRFDVNVGLLISQLVGLRSVDNMELQSDLDNKPIWQLSRYKDTDGLLWDELDIRLLLNQQEFMQVAA